MLYDIEQIIHKDSVGLPNRKMKHMPKAQAKQLHPTGRRIKGKQRKKGEREREFKI